MRKTLLISFILLSLSTSLYASFWIVLGEYQKKKEAQSCMYRFPQTDAHIEQYKDHYRVIIGNLHDKGDAKKLLRQIKRREKNAYIISHHPHQRSKLPIKVKKQKKVEKPHTQKIVHRKKVKIKKRVTTPTHALVKSPKISKQKKEPRKKHPITPHQNVKKGFSLKEAITYALQNSYKIQAAKEKVKQAEHKVRQRLAAFYPKLDLYANGGGHYLKPYQAPEVKFWKSDESLILTQNLYNGGKDSNLVKQERQNLKVAIAKYRDKVEEQSQKVIEAYLGVLFEKRSIAKAQANMQSLQKILNIVKIKAKNGAATKGDLNYIKSQVDNAQAALVKVKSKYQNALSYYEYFVGDLNESKMPVEDHFDVKLDKLQNVVENAYLFNAKIQEAKAKLKANEYAMQAQKAKFRPKLDLTITGKDKQSGYLSEPQEDRATAMLNLSYNLYNGGKDQAKLLEIKSKSRELHFILVDAKKGLKHNTQQLYENVTSTQETLQHTRDEVKANQKVIDSYWSAFKYGKQDLQALLLAQRSLNRSQLDEIKQEQAYILSYFKLLKETGELLQKLGIDAL